MERAFLLHESKGHTQESFPAQHIPHRLAPIHEAPSLTPELDQHLLEPILEQLFHGDGLGCGQTTAEVKVQIGRDDGDQGEQRAHEASSKDDGLRILVERLWPRGVSKQKAQIGLWLKDLAPSTELRKWYGHDPARWPQFRKRYQAELKGKGDVLALLKYVTEEKAVTFIYAASDEERNSAVALKEFLERGKQ